MEPAGCTAAEVGSAVHLVLAGVDPWAKYDAGSLQDIAVALERAGRVAPGSGSMMDYAAIAETLGQLASSLPRPKDIYRELPIAMAIPAADQQLSQADAGLGGRGIQAGDITYVQGIIDLLCIYENGVVVVDYKTDKAVDAAEMARRYRDQLAWYGRAVHSMLPGVEVRQVLAWIGGRRLVEL